MYIVCVTVYKLLFIFIFWIGRNELDINGQEVGHSFWHVLSLDPMLHWRDLTCEHFLGNLAFSRILIWSNYNHLYQMCAKMDNSSECMIVHTLSGYGSPQRQCSTSTLEDVRITSRQRDWGSRPLPFLEVGAIKRCFSSKSACIISCKKLPQNHYCNTKQKHTSVRHNSSVNFHDISVAFKFLSISWTAVVADHKPSPRKSLMSVSYLTCLVDPDHGQNLEDYRPGMHFW